MSAKDTPALEDRTRARLRQLRFERGLTLEQAAAAAHIATSTLSRLESGARKLTLAHVERLAGALGTSTDALLAGAGRPGPAEALDGRTWTPLSDESTAGRRAYRVLVRPGGPEPGRHGHEGHQWLYVLRGRLRLEVGEAGVTLETGQAAAFPTWLPHRLAAVGEPVELLAIFDPGGEPLSVFEPAG